MLIMLFFTYSFVFGLSPHSHYCKYITLCVFSKQGRLILCGFEVQYNGKPSNKSVLLFGARILKNLPLKDL